MRVSWPKRRNPREACGVLTDVGSRHPAGIGLGFLLIGVIVSGCGPSALRTEGTAASTSAAAPPIRNGESGARDARASSGALWPAGRTGDSVTYDPVRGNLLIFGGSEGTTWTWDGKRWTARVPPVSPAARQDALLAFDTAHRVVVLFGGVGLNDTWTWDGKAWAEQHPPTSPPARESAAMAYDPRMGTVILMGGSDNRGSLHDMWSWNGTTWTELHPNRLPQLVSEGMADDGSRLIVTGASFGEVNGRYLSQTWAWDGSSWTALHPPVNLPLDYGYSFAGDPKRGTVLFFGGGMGLIHQDTWVWDGSTWARQHPLTSPPARVLGHLVYDTRLGRALLYGGAGENGQTLGDLWAWDGSNWSQVEAGPAPESTGQPTKPAAVSMSPAAAAANIRMVVSTTHPLLLPSWLPADLAEVQVIATVEGFNVHYVNDGRDKRVSLGLVVPNPPPGGPNERSTPVLLLGVPATYHVDDATVSLSHRYLMWSQPGTGPAANKLKSGGLPYFLSADGLTDAEFWQIANSLKG